MKEKVKKIDVHAHATPYKHLLPPNEWTKEPIIGDNELIDFYDKLNIETGVLLPIVSHEAQYHLITNTDIKILVDKHPDRFVWFCNLDPRAGRNNPNYNFSDLLNFYKNLGAKGVGELTAQLPADDPLVDNLFYHCAECDMPVTIHVSPMKDPYNFYGIKDDLGLTRLEKMLKKHKNLKIFGHSQLFWAEISADVNDQNRTGYPTGKIKEGRIAELLREYPNLYCDVSANSGMRALMRDPEYTARFIEEFSDRIMYGCDICATFNTHPFMFEEWLDKFREDNMISEENYYKFVRGNAERLLNIK